MRTPRPTALHIRIDRLSVEGMSAANGRFIGQAIQSEIAKLVNRGAWTSPAADLRAGVAPGLTVPHGSTPDAIGRTVARRIFQTLGGRTRA